MLFRHPSSGQSRLQYHASTTSWLFGPTADPQDAQALMDEGQF